MKYCRLLLVFLWVIWIMCDNHTPQNVFQPDDGNPDPSISSVSPADVAYANFTEIEIAGQNFNADSAKNFVYFNNEKATLLSVTPERMVVRSPLLESDSIVIKIMAQGAYLSAVYSPYRLVYIAREWGTFSEIDEITAQDCDRDENLYVALKDKSIMKVTSNNSQTVFSTEGNSGVLSLKIGQGNLLYYCQIKKLYTIPLDNSRGLLAFNSANTAERIEDFDFGPNGNIFIAAKKGIIRMKADGANDWVADYGTKARLITIRVVGDKIYTATVDSIWQHTILNDAGDLGPRELLCDWKSMVYDVNQDEISSLTLAANGDIYVGATKTYAVYKMSRQGETGYAAPQPFYELVLIPAGFQICWGNQNFVYINRKHATDASLNKIIKVDFNTSGAAYYGRSQ